MTSNDAELIDALRNIDNNLSQIASWLCFFAVNTDEFQAQKKQDQVVLLKNAGLDTKEIARILDISSGSVRGHLSHARNQGDQE